jgi:PAS domain S-box-containing protein
MSDDGVIDSWNAGAQRLWGYPCDDIVGKRFDTLFTPGDQEAGIPARELATARREGRALDERLHQRADGTTFFASGVTTRLGDDARFGFAKIARDLTGVRRSAEELREAQWTLEQRVADRTIELEQQQAHIRGLLRQLVTTQEEQRARIARNLHDSLGQQLTALRLTIERAQQARVSGDELHEVLARSLAIIASVSRELDFLAWEMRPAVLDDLGLAAALQRFLQEWSQHYGIEPQFRLSGFRAGDLSKEAETTYYRIAQEALNNVLKHAHAKRVDVLLETSRGLVSLIVSDDGIGFDPGNAPVAIDGLGMFSMRERAAVIGATLEVESSPGQGTTVYVRCAACGPPEGSGS